MSSTPRSENAIRSPNGAPSLNNKTNPQLPDMRCAASQTRDQHTIVIWLILFVYKKIQKKKILPPTVQQGLIQCDDVSSVKTEKELVASWSWMMNCEERKGRIRELLILLCSLSIHNSFIHVSGIQQTQCCSHWSVYRCAEQSVVNVKWQSASAGIRKMEPFASRSSHFYCKFSLLRIQIHI